MLRISLNSTIRKTGAFTVRNLISEKNFLSCGAVNELRCSVASSILPTVSQINCTTASPANLAMGAIRWKTYNKGDLKKIRQRMGPKPGTPEYENQYEPDDRFISDIANSIDTTLTPEQQAYVEKIKKKYKGSYNSPRCKRQRISTLDAVANGASADSCCRSC